MRKPHQRVRCIVGGMHADHLAQMKQSTPRMILDTVVSEMTVREHAGVASLRCEADDALEQWLDRAAPLPSGEGPLRLLA